MQIAKQQLVESLRSRGDHDKAAQADAQLPDPVDPDAHADLLTGLGVDPVGLLDGASGGLEAGDDTSHDTGNDAEALQADGTASGEPENWGGSGQHEDGLGGLAGGLGGGAR